MRLVAAIKTTKGQDLRYWHKIAFQGGIPLDFEEFSELYVDMADCFYANAVITDLQSDEEVTSCLWYYCDEQELIECDKIMEEE